MAHKYTYHDGFETQDASRWNSAVGGAAELTRTSYSRAARRFNVSAASAYVECSTALSAAGGFDSTAYAATRWSMHVYIDTLPGAGVFLYLTKLRRSSLASDRAQVRINGTSGVLELYSSGSGAFTAGTYVVPTGEWFVLSVCYIQSGEVSLVLRRRDTGATVESFAAANGSNSPGDQLFVGAYTTSTGNFVVDNVVVETDATAGNIDDPVSQLTTKYACGLLYPNGVGFWDQWTGTYADVDDTPNDGDTTFRAETASAEAFTQDLSACASLVAQVGTPRSAIPFAIVKAITGAVNSQLRLRTSATDTDGTNFSVPTAGYVPMQILYSTDPATSSPWTVSALDAAQVGVERTAAAGNAVRCTLTGIEVLYTIGDVRRVRKVSYLLDRNDPRMRILDAETGDIVAYSQVKTNRWMRLLGGAPTSKEYADFYEDPSMFFIETKTYSWEVEGGETLELGPASDLVDNLVLGLTNTGSGV